MPDFIATGKKAGDPLLYNIPLYPKKKDSMKITTTILALVAAASLGQSAFADDNGTMPLALAVVGNGHGSYHTMYYQTAPGGADTTVAMYTDSGGVTTNTTLYSRERPLNDDGQIRFVVGNNQHAQARPTYIPVSSNFAPAGQ